LGIGPVTIITPFLAKGFVLHMCISRKLRDNIRFTDTAKRIFWMKGSKLNCIEVLKKLSVENLRYRKKYSTHKNIQMIQ